MSTSTKRGTQSRCLPWFGADTQVAEKYAALLADCKHVTVPFCGGLSVVAHLAETAGEIVCNDKHALAINFYNVISDPESRDSLLAKLNVTPFHATILERSQAICKAPANDERTAGELAYHYFITCWMGRSGKAGTNSEFNGGLALRWDSGGGSSPLRFQTAVRSIQDVWGPICERCSFVCSDWTEIINKVKDDRKSGVYIDCPWPDAGDSYAHGFRNPEDHVRLRNELLRFDSTKIVIRYGEHELIRKLYSEPRWTVKEITSRDQANGGVAELCITNFEVTE